MQELKFWIEERNLNGNRLKAAPLTWRKVHGSKFYEIANPVRFVSISVKAFMKDGKRGPVVAGPDGR